MYNPALIQASFKKLVGFMQPDDPQTPMIPAGNDLLLSDSGIYLQNVHPLCTIDNLWLAAPDFTLAKYYAWVSMTPYLTGNKRTDGGKIYQCILSVTSATHPSADPTHWAVYDPFTAWLIQLYTQSSSNMLGEIVQRKKLLKMGKAILEKQRLYNGYGQSIDLIVKSGRFLGFIFKPQPAEGLTIQIDKVGFQGNHDENLPIYIYHTSKDFETWSQIIATTANDFSWEDLLNAVVAYSDYNSEGFYVFGYYEDDLIGQAVNKAWNCAVMPVVSCCDGINLAMYNKWSRYTTFRNLQVPASALQPDKSLFDITKISLDSNSNWGLNLSITVRCDLTNTVIASRLFLADAFAKQLALECLKKIAYSNRGNPFNGNIKQLAMADLDPKVSGSFINDYNKAIDAANMDLSGFNRACMPEDATQSMKWSSL